MKYDKKRVETMKAAYPEGTRIELNEIAEEQNHTDLSIQGEQYE